MELALRSRCSYGFLIENFAFDLRLINNLTFDCILIISAISESFGGKNVIGVYDLKCFEAVGNGFFPRRRVLFL